MAIISFIKKILPVRCRGYNTIKYNVKTSHKRVTRWVPHVVQGLISIPELLSSPRGFSEIRVARSLIFCVMFVDRCLSFCPFSFDDGIVCPSSI